MSVTMKLFPDRSFTLSGWPADHNDDVTVNVHGLEEITLPVDVWVSVARQIQRWIDAPLYGNRRITTDGCGHYTYENFGGDLDCVTVRFTDYDDVDLSLSLTADGWRVPVAVMLSWA